MRVLAPIAIAFGMFSRLPVPMVDWNEKNLRYALCAFPLVGLVQGGLALGWGLLAAWLGLPPLLVAVVLALLPVAVNGGIHLDGLCDTADALASHAPREKKLEILKDPHIGAFGVLALVCHLLLCVALFTGFCSAIPELLCLPCVYGLSRALSGWAVVCWPAAKREGTASSFHGGSAGGPAAALLLAQVCVFAGCIVLLRGVLGGGVALAAVLVLLYYRRMSKKQFGGVTGDLAGWFLQTAELWMLAVLVIGGIYL